MSRRKMRVAKSRSSTKVAVEPNSYLALPKHQRRVVGQIERSRDPFDVESVMLDALFRQIGNVGTARFYSAPDFKQIKHKACFVDMKTAPQTFNLEGMRQAFRAGHDTVVIDSLPSLMDVDLSQLEKRMTDVVWLDEAHMIDPPEWKNSPHRYGRAIDLAVPQAKHHAALSNYLAQYGCGRLVWQTFKPKSRMVWQTFKPKSRMTAAEKVARWTYLYGGAGEYRDDLLRYSIRDAVLSSEYDPVRREVDGVPLQWIAQQRRNRDAAPLRKAWMADTRPAVYALHKAVWDAGYTCNGVSP